MAVLRSDYKPREKTKTTTLLFVFSNSTHADIPNPLQIQADISVKAGFYSRQKYLNTDILQYSKQFPKSEVDTKVELSGTLETKWMKLEWKEYGKI